MSSSKTRVRWSSLTSLQRAALVVAAAVQLGVGRGCLGRSGDT